MPSILTHIVAADIARKEMKNQRINDVISANLPAYYSGTQGGDYFYLYHYYSMFRRTKYKMYGWALHYARVQRFFTEGAEYVKQQGSALLQSFFYGYITHYALDMMLHPPINASTKPMSTHNTLESALDVMYAQKNGVDALAMDKGKLVEDTLVSTGEVDKFFLHMAHLYDDFKLKPNAYQDSYRYYADFQHQLSHPDEKTMRHFKRLNMISQLNIFTLLYHNPEEIKDQYDYDYYFDLIDRAIKWGVKRIEIVDKYFHDETTLDVVESAFYNINFHGKPVIPREERKIFKRMYKKAPTRFSVKETPPLRPNIITNQEG